MRTTNVPLQDLLPTWRLILWKRNANYNPELHVDGDETLLHQPCVAVIGSRRASVPGVTRAAKLARQLTAAGVVVVSGLARGIDTAAHEGTLQAEGKTVAVLGTPLNRHYPQENRALQEQLRLDHLLVSPFPAGRRTQPRDFPTRNRVMAALTDATVIVEASATSGTRHQAAACLAFGRPVFVLRSLRSAEVPWVDALLEKPGVYVLDDTEQLLEALSRRMVPLSR